MWYRLNVGKNMEELNNTTNKRGVPDTYRTRSPTENTHFVQVSNK